MRYAVISVGPADGNSVWPESFGPCGVHRSHSHHDTLASAIVAASRLGYDTCRYDNGCIYDNMTGEPLSVADARNQLRGVA